MEEEEREEEEDERETWVDVPDLQSESSKDMLQALAEHKALLLRGGVSSHLQNLL